MFGYPDAEGRAQRPHFINVELTVAAGATERTQPAVNVGSRDFVWTHIGIRASQPFKIRIRDTGANVVFQNEGFHTETIVGTNNYRPFALPVPWRFTRNTAIEVEAENLGSSADTIYITFIGYLD